MHFSIYQACICPVGITPGDVLINDGEDHMYDINKRTAFEK